MKILVIHGSMRKGNTYTLAKEVMDRLAKKPDVEIIEYSVAELDLPFCISCHVCFSKGEASCPHFGRLERVTSALLECDGLILSGVSYVRALNGAMKNLIDHFAYFFHRPALFGKHGMVIATSAGTGERRVARYLRNVMGQWGVNGALIVTQNAKKQRLQSSPKAAKRLDEAAERFYQRIQSKQRISPSAQNIAVHNAFRAMLLSEFTDAPADTRYWQQSGFSDRAYPVKTNPVKYLIGALTYRAANAAIRVVGRSYKKKQKDSSTL